MHNLILNWFIDIDINSLSCIFYHSLFRYDTLVSCSASRGLMDAPRPKTWELKRDHKRTPARYMALYRPKVGGVALDSLNLSPGMRKCHLWPFQKEVLVGLFPFGYRI
jgi:hypothetical protein